MLKKANMKRLKKQLGGNLKWEELFNRYTFINEIGRGGFGITHLVYDNLDKKQQVAKVATINEENYYTYKVELDNLIEIYKNTCRNDLVCIRNYYTEILDDKTRKLVIILDKVEGIELFKLINMIKSNKITLQVEDYFYIFKNLLKSIDYLHNKLNMAHMDIKPENIMINPITFNTTIIDVGLSCKEIFCNPGGTATYISKNVLKNFETGSRFSKDTAKRNDIYSMGIIFLEMLNLLDLDEFIIESKSKKTFVEKGYYFNDIIQNLINFIEIDTKKYMDKKDFQPLVDVINLSVIMVKKNLLIDSIMVIFNTIEKRNSEMVKSTRTSLENFFNKELPKENQ
jgi:serine/threonine protein kinase